MSTDIHIDASKYTVLEQNVDYGTRDNYYNDVNRVDSTESKLFAQNYSISDLKVTENQFIVTYEKKIKENENYDD